MDSFVTLAPDITRLVRQLRYVAMMLIIMLALSRTYPITSALVAHAFRAVAPDFHRALAEIQVADCLGHAVSYPAFLRR